MKAVLVLAVLAVLGFTVAGCGATKKVNINVGPNLVRLRGPNTVKVSGSATIPTVSAGTRIGCVGWKGQGVKVPPRGATANVGEGTATLSGTGSSSRQMQVKHLENGSVIVSCTFK